MSEKSKEQSNEYCEDNQQNGEKTLSKLDSTSAAFFFSFMLFSMVEGQRKWLAKEIGKVKQCLEVVENKKENDEQPIETLAKAERILREIISDYQEEFGADDCQRG